MLTVHLRVNDPATGRPTPVRLRVVGPDGTYHAPLGRQTEFATGRGEDVGGNLLLGRERFAYIDGSCEIRLPSGVPLRVEIDKGPEFRPLRQTVTLGPGQMALRLTLERACDLAAEGWHAGDGRAHFLPPHAARLEGAAEGLAVVNLLAFETQLPSADGRAYPATPNLTAFSGRQPALPSDDCLVVVNTLNTHPVLGAVALLNCHRIVFPLTFGGADATDDWSVCDWCDQCHRKGGLTVWSDFAGAGGEALAALLLGKIDALEVTPEAAKKPHLREWARLAAAGAAAPLVGASAKMSSRTPLGAVRTYAGLRPGEALSYAAWVEAVRAGRTFITNGPLLRFTVDGHPPGSVIDRPAGPLVARAEAFGIAPFERLEVLADGEVIADATPSAGGARLEVEHAPVASCRLTARCRGAGPSPFDRQSAVFAHASPVTVRLDGRPPAVDPTAALRVGERLGAAADWVERDGRFDDPRSRDHLLAVFAKARQGLSGS